MIGGFGGVEVDVVAVLVDDAVFFPVDRWESPSSEFRSRAGTSGV